MFWATAGGMGLTGIVTEATLAAPAGRDRAHGGRHRARRRRRRLHGAHARHRRPLPLLRRVDRLPRRAASTSAGRCSRAATTRRSTICPPPSAPARAAFAPRTRRATAAVDAERLAQPALDPRVQRALVPQGARASAATRSSRSPRSSTRSTRSSTGTASTDRDGFVQYQFVVPYGAEAVVRTGARTTERAPVRVVPRGAEALRARQPAPCSASRRRDGRSRSTFPRRAQRVAALLDGLDDLVVEAGGRVYLTKDSRLRARARARRCTRNSIAGARSASSLDPRHALSQRHGSPPRPAPVDALTPDELLRAA